VTAALVTGRKAAQKRFSEENFRNLRLPIHCTTPETYFSTASPQAFAELCENSRSTASLDELAELNNYSNGKEMSSTQSFRRLDYIEASRKKDLAGDGRTRLPNRSLRFAGLLWENFSQARGNFATGMCGGIS
jgi:hypothetical protein